MSPSTDSSLPKPRSRSLRMLDDLRLAVGISALAALIITLVVGRPESLFEQFVFSMSIGVIGFAIVNGARIWFLDNPARRPLTWPALLVLMALAAPVAHYSGFVLGGLVFGISIPTIAEYPTLSRVSMMVLTFVALALMTLVIVHRERVQRRSSRTSCSIRWPTCKASSRRSGPRHRHARPVDPVLACHARRFARREHHVGQRVRCDGSVPGTDEGADG